MIKPDEQLLFHLQSGLKKRHQQGEAKREGNHIHATNLIDFCPREYLLCIKHKVFFNQPKPTSTAQMLTFEIGRAIEHVVISALRLEKVVIDKEPLEIKEIPFPIIATPDIYTIFSTLDMPYIVEVKSIKPEDFDNLSEPIVNHECQLSLYLWFAQALNMKAHTEAGLVLYVAKTQKPMPFKAFFIQRNEAFIGRVKEQLTTLKTFSKSKKLPPRICNSKLALMARRPCKCLKECFDVK